MDKTRLKALLKGILRLVFSGVLLYYIFTIVDYRDVTVLLKQANPFLVFSAFLCFILSKITSAIRLNLLFHSIDIKISFLTNLKLYLLGMFYNLFLPGGIGGDGYKVFLLHKNYKTPVKKLIWVVFLDRLIGLAALGMMALIMMAFIKQLGPIRHYAWIILVAGILIVAFLISKYLEEVFQFLQRIIYQSFLVQILQLLSIVFLLLSHGESNNFLSYLTIFLVSSMVSILPISIGGAGMRELTFLYGSQLLGLDMNVSVSISLLFYLFTALSSLGGIVFVIFPLRVRIETEK